MSVSFECCVLSVEVSATGWSLVQRSPTDCGVSVIVKPRQMRRPRPPRGCRAIRKKNIYIYVFALSGSLSVCLLQLTIK
jgi:hypothetical protein